MTMSSQEIIAVYEAMAVITDQMVLAATDNDWDRMVLLEQQCALHLLQLKDNEQQTLAGTERVRKIDAIRKILDGDRKIRDLTTPWMARLSALINNAGTERRLARAYGA